MKNSYGELVADQDFAYTEFVKCDETGYLRIVGTGYKNSEFPLIRYDTGDWISLTFEDNRPIIASINGRNQDCVILPNGVKLGRLDHIFKSLEHISEVQIHQTALENIQIRTVKGAGYSLFDEQKLLKEIKKRFGKEIQIAITYCNFFERTSSRKFKLVISDILTGLKNSLSYAL